MSKKRLGTGTSTSPYDVIIVLGAAVWQGGKPSPTLRRRVLYAVDLFNQGQGRQLLFTGGLGQYPPPEAEVMRQIALEQGVPASCMVLEDQAASTFWSAVYCRVLMRQHDWSSALIVTDRYHLPRAELTFRQLTGGPGMTITGRAVVPHRLTWRPTWKLKSWLRAYGREWVAFVWYLLKIAVWKVSHPN